MRQIRIFEHISADGVIAPGTRPNDYEFTHGGWTAPFRSPEGASAVAEAQRSDFDLLLGRRTYDLWAGYWPTVRSGVFAERMNAARKYVVTHRPENLPWEPAEGLSGDIIAGVRRVKSGEGPDVLVWGSSTLTSLLVEHGLVDEIVLCVYPVMLGRGVRAFADLHDLRTLSLAASKALPSGVVINSYRVIETA